MTMNSKKQLQKSQDDWEQRFQAHKELWKKQGEEITKFLEEYYKLHPRSVEQAMEMKRAWHEDED